MIGPASVPTPPRMAINAARMEMLVALKTISGSIKNVNCATWFPPPP